MLNLLLHLGFNVTDLDFSGLSVWQAYLRGADLPDMNFRNADFTGSTFTDYAGSVMCVVCSPDGEWLAAGADNGSIYLWQMAMLRWWACAWGITGKPARSPSMPMARCW